MPTQSGPLLRELCGVLCPSPHTLQLPAALRLLPFPAELLQESPWFPRRRSRRPEPTLPRCWEAATTHPGIRPTSSSPFALIPPPHRLAGRAGEGSMRWDVCPVSSASHTVLMTLLHLGRASGHGERRSLTGSGRQDLWALPADVPSSTRDRVSPGTGRLGVARAQATSAVGHLRRGPPPCRAVRPASWCGPPHI